MASIISVLPSKPVKFKIIGPIALPRIPPAPFTSCGKIELGSKCIHKIPHPPNNARKIPSERIEKTKVIEESYLDTLENNKSKPRVPFGSLVELGIIKPGTDIFDQKKKISAKIMVDGSIKHAQAEGSIHKVAATILGAESCNGWTYWHCQVGNNIVPIDNLRQKFLHKND